jgi:hypothetical protein
MNSLLATELAISVASGTAPLGLARMAAPPQPVLLVSELVPEDTLADRVLRLCRARRIQPPDQLSFQTLGSSPIVDSGGFLSKLNGEAVDRHARVVILESAHLKPVEESDLFAEDNLAHIAHLPRRLKACIVLVCWTGNRRAYATRYRSSSPIVYASGTLRVEPKGPNSFSLVPYGFIGGNDPDRTFVEVVHGGEGNTETLQLLAHGRGSRLPAEELEAKVLAALADGTAESRTKLHQRLGGRKELLLRVVDRLIDQGRIECERHGSSHRLMLPPPTESA